VASLGKNVAGFWTVLDEDKIGSWVTAALRLPNRPSRIKVVTVPIPTVNTVARCLNFIFSSFLSLARGEDYDEQGNG
jgi:hypothetical protein